MLELPDITQVETAVASGEGAAVIALFRQQQKVCEQLRERDELLRLFIEHAPAAIAMFDTEMRYLATSRRWLTDYGLGERDIIGLSHYEVFPEIPERWKVIHNRTLTGSVEHADEDPFIRADGHTDWVRWEIHPWRKAGGEIGGIIMFTEVITERKRTEERIKEYAENLRRQTAQLLASNKELEAFSYTISHTMRAPLRSIDGFSQALMEEHSEKLDEHGRNYLSRIRASAQRMGQLIEDILTLSRITRESMFWGEVNLSILALAVLDNLRKTEPDRRVETVIPEGIIAKGDEELLRLALHHLLGNAWKFTAHQPATRIEFGANQEEGRMVYFVRDNGVGFDMQYAVNIFTPFIRLHTDDKFPGTGIGLSIVKRIIDRHGGTIWAESGPGKGATFYFTLGEE